MDGASCAPDLTAAIETLCKEQDFSWVSNGRFKGGWTTRHYGHPDTGVHAVQMEIALRAYLAEPDTATPRTWPPDYDAARAAPLRALLGTILTTCLHFATAPR